MKDTAEPVISSTNRRDVELFGRAIQGGPIVPTEAELIDDFFETSNDREVGSWEPPRYTKYEKTWDAMPDESGHIISIAEAEDEANLSIEMNEQGREAAEQDLRKMVRSMRR